MKTSDRTLYMKTMVAGVGYHEIDEVGYLLHEGSKVQLLRERDNEYDSNAVSVISVSYTHLTLPTILLV